MGVSTPGCPPIRRYPYQQNSRHKWETYLRKKGKELGFPDGHCARVILVPLKQSTAEKGLFKSQKIFSRLLKGVHTLTAIKVPGRNMRVAKVIICIDAVSRSVFSATLCMLFVIRSISIVDVCISTVMRSIRLAP